MTTITIKNNESLSQTVFNSTQDLYIFLRKELEPLKLFQIDEENISKDSLKKIEESINNPNKQLSDFQG